LTRPRDFGKTGEVITVADWVDAKVLLPRLHMISQNLTEIRGRSNVGRAWADLTVLIRELEEKKGVKPSDFDLSSPDAGTHSSLVAGIMRDKRGGVKDGV